jgi:DNA-binding response OmpR family regulator
MSYEPALLMTRQLMLEAQGYVVVSALGYTEAQKKCAQGSYDLLILGHSIPESDKRALISEFRANCPAPIVSLLRRGESVVDGADYHVSPDDPRTLIREIRTILPPVEDLRAKA